MRKYFIAIIIIFITTEAFSQTYSPGAFVEGTKTVEMLKQRFTNAQIKTMLENADISRNNSDGNRLGFVFTDPLDSKEILVCNGDTYVILFEYIKLLKQEITTLKSRLQTAGIP